MKKTSILLLYIILFIHIVEAQCSPQDSVIYEKAYSYISNDSIMYGKIIEISKKSANTFYMFFSECFENDNESQSHLMERLYNKDISNDSVNNNIPCFSIEYNNIKYESNMLLEFSEIKENDLFVSVSTMNFFNHLFEQTYYYYFHFDKNGNILFVSKKIMHGL